MLGVLEADEAVPSMDEVVGGKADWWNKEKNVEDLGGVRLYQGGEDGHKYRH